MNDGKRPKPNRWGNVSDPETQNRSASICTRSYIVPLKTLETTPNMI